VLIEPGFIKTELRNKKVDVAGQIEAYAVRRAKIRNSFDASVKAVSRPTASPR
jgi:hypothetical protein